MNKQNSQSEKPQKQRRLDPELLKKGLRCDLDQYEFLHECSKKGEEGIKGWNNWRAEHPKEEIWLQGLKFSEDAYLERAYLAGAHLEDAKLWYANLKNAHFGEANLEGADLRWSHLEGAIFVNSSLQKAKLIEAHLEETNFAQAHLESTDFSRAHLEKADLSNSHLEGAELINTHLEGTKLMGASLIRSHLIGAIVNGNTNMWKVRVNRFTTSAPKLWLYTDLSGVPLQSVIIDPPTKQLIEYNIRRKFWIKWINQKDWNEIVHYQGIERNILGKVIRYPIHLFFWISDYGISTKRIIFTFFGLAFIFALLYRLFPGFVMVYGNVGDIRGLWHALYFSVVTMTTLGFGDIAANPDSWWGQTLLMVQVILGYVLLGALVTRFAVLFTAGGPAGRFADEKEKEDKIK